jgi:hypothetical protein
MRVLISFAPLIVFPILVGFYSVGLGLWASCFAVAGDLFISRRSVKLLDAGQLILFSALALFGTLFHPAWDESWVRLVINAGYSPLSSPRLPSHVRSRCNMRMREFPSI